MGIKWVIAAARKKEGKAMDERLSIEIMDALNSTVICSDVGSYVKERR